MSQEEIVELKDGTSIQDIDPIEFLEDYLGIKLLVYQKEILRKMWSTGKIYIYPWQSYERPKIYEMAKCFSLIGEDITEVKKHVTNKTN
jgi:hypothetical protein